MIYERYRMSRGKYGGELGAIGGAIFFGRVLAHVGQRAMGCSMGRRTVIPTRCGPGQRAGQYQATPAVAPHHVHGTPARRTGTHATSGSRCRARCAALGPSLRSSVLRRLHLVCAATRAAAMRFPCARIVRMLRKRSLRLMRRGCASDSEATGAATSESATGFAETSRRQRVSDSVAINGSSGYSTDPGCSMSRWLRRCFLGNMQRCLSDPRRAKASESAGLRAARLPQVHHTSERPQRGPGQHQREEPPPLALPGAVRPARGSGSRRSPPRIFSSSARSCSASYRVLRAVASCGSRTLYVVCDVQRLRDVEGAGKAAAGLAGAGGGAGDVGGGRAGDDGGGADAVSRAGAGDERAGAWAGWR